MALPDTSFARASRTAVGPLTDPSVMINLANLPLGWRELVDTADGTKGRASKEDETELGIDWISFSNGGGGAVTGWARVKWTGTWSGAVANTIRIYPPVAANDSVASDAEFGAENAYDTHWISYWPQGAGVDHTSNGLDLISQSGLSPGDVAGQVGLGTDYDGGSQTADITSASLTDLPATHDFTVMFWSNSDVAEISAAALAFSGVDDLVMYPNSSGAGSGGAKVFWRDLGGNIIDEAGSDLSGTWFLSSFVGRSNTDREVYRDEVSVGSDATDGSGAGPFTDFRLGGFAGGSSQTFNGQLNEVKVHDTALSDDWRAEEFASTKNNLTYWSEWELVEGGVPPSFDDDVVELTVVMAQEQPLEVVMAQEQDLEVVMAQEQALTVVI